MRLLQSQWWDRLFKASPAMASPAVPPCWVVASQALASQALDPLVTASPATDPLVTASPATDFQAV